VLRTTDTGVVFRVADQVAMVLLGVLLAGGVLLLARPRVRADADGIEIRNTGWPRYLPWELVRAVSFPDGASWARLDLPDHEYVAVLAVQAVDGAHAVEAIRGLRARHAAAHAATTPDAAARGGAARDDVPGGAAAGDVAGGDGVPGDDGPPTART
jgi:Bacterial PH domain